MPFFFFYHPYWFHWPHMFGQPAFNSQIAQKALAPVYREFSRKSHLDLRDARRKGHVHPGLLITMALLPKLQRGRNTLAFRLGEHDWKHQMLQIGLLPSLSSTCLKIISRFSPGIAVFLQGFPWTWFPQRPIVCMLGFRLWLRVWYKRWGLEGYLHGDGCVCLVFLRVFLTPMTIFPSIRTNNFSWLTLGRWHFGSLMNFINDF